MSVKSLEERVASLEENILDAGDVAALIDTGAKTMIWFT